MTGPAISGVRWTSSATAATLAIQLVYTAAISRLLPPAAFGVVALGTVLLRFTSVFAQLGLGSAVVQKPELSDEDVRSAFTASVMLGTVMCAVAWLLAPVGAGVLGDPELTGVVRGLALSLLVTGLGTPSLAILRRNLRFRALALAEVSSFALGYLVVGLGMAVAGAGVWSLVLASLAQSASLAALTYGATRHPLTPLVDRARMGVLCGFGGRVSVIGFLEYWSANADTVVVGRLLGAGALGLYNRASLLVVLPMWHLSNTATKVLLPSFSRIQHDVERLARAYVGAFALVAGVLLPVCASIAASAVELVHVLLGDQFEPAARIVPVVAVAAGTSMLTHLPAVVLEARGALRRKLVIQVVHLAGMAIALTIVARDHRSLVAIAVAWSAAELLRHGLYVVAMSKELPCPHARLARCYRQAIGLAALVVVAMTGTGALLAAQSVPTPLLLAAKGTAGLGAYLVVVRLRPTLELRRELSARNLLGSTLGVSRYEERQGGEPRPGEGHRISTVCT